MSDPTLPPIADFNASTVTESQFRTALSGLRSYLAGGIGTTGTPAAVRTALELGTAAQATLMTATADATAGRVLRLGDWGVGATDSNTLADIDAFDIRQRLWRVNNTTTAGTLPPGNTTSDGVMVFRPSGNQTTQLYFIPNGGLSYIRSSNGTSSWNPWRLLYTQASLVGTVSQTGGVPTGAVIQRGKNANGEFVRFADGTQKCWSYVDSTIDITTASNMGAGFFNATPIEWVFPMPFAADADEFSPIVRALSYSNNPRSAVISCSWSGPSSTVADKGLIYLHRPVSEAASAYGLYVEASGRWF